MPYGNAAPLTGGAGALVPSHVFGLDHIIGGALAAVLFGIALYRYGSRIERGRKSILAFVGALVAGTDLFVHHQGLSWFTSAVIGLIAAVTTLCLFNRFMPRGRRVVA